MFFYLQYVINGFDVNLIHNKDLLVYDGNVLVFFEIVFIFGHFIL